MSGRRLHCLSFDYARMMPPSKISCTVKSFDVISGFVYGTMACTPLSFVFLCISISDLKIQRHIHMSKPCITVSFDWRGPRAQSQICLACASIASITHTHIVDATRAGNTELCKLVVERERCQVAVYPIIRRAAEPKTCLDMYPG
jgi:hypothetical protein